jgi:hypothetical protein
VERKRHIGNDVVTLVFKERDSPLDLFNPMMITSHFLQTFIVVEPLKSKRTSYRVTIANKAGVVPYGAYFPPTVIRATNGRATCSRKTTSSGTG